jgi:hypothetical protein
MLVVAAVFTGVLLLGNVLVTSASVRTVGQDATAMIPIGQTLGWVVDLVVAEVIIRRRRVTHPPRAGVRADAASRR